MTAPPLCPSPPPAFKSRPFSPPPFPIMTRNPDRERDTERRRDQRRLHQERLAVLARCTCSCHIAGCPPCSTLAPPRGGPALPVSSSCAPPAGQGRPVAGGAWVPPPNATTNQGGGNWAGGGDGHKGGAVTRAHGCAAGARGRPAACRLHQARAGGKKKRISSSGAGGGGEGAACVFRSGTPAASTRSVSRRRSLGQRAGGRRAPASCASARPCPGDPSCALDEG